MAGARAKVVSGVRRHRDSMPHEMIKAERSDHPLLGCQQLHVTTIHDLHTSKEGHGPLNV